MTPKDIERFWSHVDVRGGDDCWEWRAARRAPGYGAFSVGGRSGGMRTASRVAYELVNGPAGSLHVRHTCDNPPCCNPSHLVAGTQTDNMRDMAERERSWKTKLNAADVAAIRFSSEGKSSKRLAEEYGVHPSSIVQIRAGVTWKHVTAEMFARLIEGGVTA